MASNEVVTGVSLDETTAVQLLTRFVQVSHSVDRMRDYELANLSASMGQLAESHPGFWKRHTWLQSFWDRLEEEIAFRAPFDDQRIDQIDGQLCFDDTDDGDVVSIGAASEQPNGAA